MGFFDNKVNEHHRNYPFRPERKEYEDKGTDWPLYWRFIKQYAWPKKWSLLLCIIFVALNSTATYLMSFYNRLVVDDILVIKTEAPVKSNTDERQRIWRPDREMFGNSRPVVSMGRRMDNGFRLSAREPEAGRHLLIIAIVYMGTQILLNFMARFSTRQQIVVAQGITGKLREDMHQKVLDLSMAYHQSMSPGRLLSRILSDVDSVRAEMMGLFTSATHCTSMICVGFSILIVEDWRMALIAFAVTPVYAYMYKHRRPLIRRLNLELRHTNACLYGLVTQKIEGIKAIQAYAREKGELLYFHKMIACSLRDTLLTLDVSASLSRSASVLTGLSSSAIFLYGGMLVLDGRMTLGKMLFLHSTTMTLFVPVLEFAQLSFVLQRLRTALLRVAGVLDKKIEIKDTENAVDFPKPLVKGIELRDVFFAYPAMQSNKEGVGEDLTPAPPPEPVLKGINVFVPAGSWLCIMGASGSGKTTLLHLLSHLYEPTFGDIFFDGVNIKDIHLASFRKCVGIVPQEAQIFSGSMRDNICYGRPDATNQQIMDAAEAAQMHEFIMGMKVQYETLIGQRGSSLSGGQRQRLSLARALLTNPDLLILDDCTSALDANTERKIQETLAKILVGKTAIMVSQRVSMAMRCHKIAVIENGVISEYGTHAELLEKGGFYAKLFHQQTE